eukprot:scaffold15358_cov146-Cylindrotheca_fusiformis.AAC.2
MNWKWRNNLPMLLETILWQKMRRLMEETTTCGFGSRDLAAGKSVVPQPRVGAGKQKMNAELLGRERTKGSEGKVA